MSTTVGQDPIELLGNEPKAEVRYLSDGVGQPEVIGAERQEVAAVGARFLKATGGNACLAVVGPLVSTEKDGQSTESAIIRCCRARFGYPSAPFPGTIDLILDTIGGSLDSAFKTVLFLSRFAERLRVFVPRRAKSAGTLIAIGADELYLSPFGELGPLDTQIRDPRNPADRVSALDCYQSVDYVRTFGLSTLGRTFRALAAETRTLIPLAELVNTAANFSIGSISPILTQVNALDFGGWGRTLKIGEMYAQVLLSRVGYDKEDAAEIANRLVYGYTHHPFPIDVDELERIGLNARLMSKDQYENALEIVRRCAQPGVAVVGFIEEEATQPGGPVTDASSDRSTEHVAAGAKAAHRRHTQNVASDGQTHPVAALEDGEEYMDSISEEDEPVKSSRSRLGPPGGAWA